MCNEESEVRAELLELQRNLVDRLDAIVDEEHLSFAHQLAIKDSGIQTAVGISTHELAEAVDIRTGKHTGEELAEVARKCGIKALGIAPTWLHLDLRSDKEREWRYF